MLKRLRLTAFVAVALVHGSCLPLLEGEQYDLAGKTVRLTFLQTADIHSRLLPYDFSPLRTDQDLGLIPAAAPFGGATRLAALIKRERAKSDRVLHLDSGDVFQGAPIFNANKGEAEFRFLSTVGVDAAVVGNHEFDAGALNFTLKAQAFAHFPLLAANYVWMESSQLDSNQTALVTHPYVIRNVKGVKVGIVGLANISSLNSIVEGNNSLQATPLEQNEIIRGYVELMKPVVDLIVVVSHAGLTEDQDLVQGYEAYYEYGRIKSFVERTDQPWKVLEWFGPQDDPNSLVRVQIPGVNGIDLILGGHLHVVLNPPQQLRDPSGRRVILSHGGAFAKYMNRIDAVLQMPPAGGAEEGAEIVSYDFHVFPIDSLWCSDAMHNLWKSQFWTADDFVRDPRVQQAMADCTNQEDLETTQLLQPYIIGLDQTLGLSSIFGYAPQDIARRNNSTGGDSPLGNLAADSMRKRRRVEAEVAVTNSLGIRDNLYAGVMSQESMFNVFPFENTINVMFLTGREMQELFDFITDRSAGRGCGSQAQISGARFTMDCAQTQLNALRWPCTPEAADPTATCAQIDTGARDERAPWQCLADDTVSTGGRCWAHTGIDISINGQGLEPNITYRVAVNDYIAKGGSGFLVLKRNTTRVETGIPLRDSLVGYLADFCTCDDLIADKRDGNGDIIGKKGQACGVFVDGVRTIPAQITEYCKSAASFRDALSEVRGDCDCKSAFRHDDTACKTTEFDPLVSACRSALPSGPVLGKCGCRDALAGDPACGNLTREVRDFCENPTAMPVAFGVEDGRISRRVK